MQCGSTHATSLSTVRLDHAHTSRACHACGLGSPQMVRSHGEWGPAEGGVCASSINLGPYTIRQYRYWLLETLTETTAPVWFEPSEAPSAKPAAIHELNMREHRWKSGPSTLSDGRTSQYSTVFNHCAFLSAFSALSRTSSCARVYDKWVCVHSFSQQRQP